MTTISEAAARDLYVAEFEIDDEDGVRLERRVFIGPDAALMRALCEDEEIDLLDAEDDDPADELADILAAQDASRAALARCGLVAGDLPF